MKPPVAPHMVACLIVGLIAPLSAQNFVGSHIPSDSRLKAQVSALPGSYEVPAMERVKGETADAPALFTPQDAITLEEKRNPSRDVASVVNLDILRNPSPYRKVMVSTMGSPYDISTDSLLTGLAEISAVYRKSGNSEKPSDCQAISLSVGQRIKLDPSRVLENVELEVSANPGCCCEIVKSAIKSSEADVDQVVAIVEVAIHAAPESMRIISQCAIATSPDALAAIQSLLARLDPNAGETGYSSKSAKSAKSAKDAKVASIVAPTLPNPLDLPPIIIPFFIPPIIPPPLTEVNP